MIISASLVKELRDRTKCGFMACKSALVETNGDIEKAIEYLRKIGISIADEKAGRKVSEGLICSYIHENGKVGVLLEINCETDFVARTNEFKELAKEIAIQIAALDPEYIGKEDVPVEKMENIVFGKLDQDFFMQKCLLEQPYIRDGRKKVKEILRENIGRLKENIKIKRFVRFERR